MIEVVKVFVPLIGIIITVFGGAKIKFHYDKKNKEIELLKKDNQNLKEEIKDLSLSVQMDLQVFNDIKDVVENILTKTKADRFLILTATNGIRDLRFATAIYEQHKNNDKIQLSIGATGKYIKFEFDSEYKQMLKNVEAQGLVSLKTAEMRESDLKSIYETEEINHSNVYFLMRGKIDNENDRLFYCSVSTHSKTDYTKQENSLIKVGVSKMKSKFEEL